MKYIIFILTLLILPLYSTNSHSDQKSLSAEAVEFVKQYDRLKADPANTTLQRIYLKAFPHNKETFKSLFDRDDFSELYNNSEQYIFLIGDLSEINQNEVGLLLISITKGGAPGCCDAWSALHKVTSIFAKRYTQSFASLLNKMPEDQKENIVCFIADKENHYTFKDYQVIIDNLKKLKEDRLAGQFEIARTKRMSLKDH